MIKDEIFTNDFVFFCDFKNNNTTYGDRVNMV